MEKLEKINSDILTVQYQLKKIVDNGDFHT